MENGSQGSSTRRYPFFWKKQRASNAILPSVPTSSSAGVVSETVDAPVGVPESNGIGLGNECCAPGLRLPGCTLEAELARIRTATLRLRIIRHVIACPTEGSIRKVIASIKESIAYNKTACGWIALAGHPSPGFHHVHTLHDCRFAKSTCTCAFLQPYRIKYPRLPEGWFQPHIRPKKGPDLREIYGDDISNTTSDTLANLLQ